MISIKQVYFGKKITKSDCVTQKPCLVFFYLFFPDSDNVKPKKKHKI